MQDNRQDNVHFVGQISEEDKVALHHLSHAFVFPSHQRTEAFGLALIEAAILGKPMISCEIGTATSFVNSDGETGIVIPPASPEAIREAMQGLIKHPEKAKTYGEQAKKRYLALLTPEKQAKAYVALYEQLGMTWGDRAAFIPESLL